MHSPEQQVGSLQVVCTALPPSPLSKQGLQCKGSKGQPSNTEFQERLPVHSPNQQIGSPKLDHTVISPSPPLNKVLKWKGSEGQPSKTQFQERFHVHSPNQQSGSLKAAPIVLPSSPVSNQGFKCKGGEGPDRLNENTPPSEQRKPRTFKRLKKARELLPSSASKERADDPGCLAKKSKVLQKKNSKLGELFEIFSMTHLKLSM